MARTKQKNTPQQDNAAGEGEEATGGVLLEKEDIQLIYKALRSYTPTGKEEQLYDHTG